MLDCLSAADNVEDLGPREGRGWAKEHGGLAELGRGCGGGGGGLLLAFWAGHEWLWGGPHGWGQRAQNDGRDRRASGLDSLGAEPGGVIGGGINDDVHGEARVSIEDDVDGVGAVVAVVVLGWGRWVEPEDVLDVEELGLDDVLGEHGEKLGVVLDDPVARVDKGE